MTSRAKEDALKVGIGFFRDQLQESKPGIYLGSPGV
jgi:hypothetical protein